MTFMAVQSIHLSIFKWDKKAVERKLSTAYDYSKYRNILIIQQLPLQELLLLLQQLPPQELQPLLQEEERE